MPLFGIAMIEPFAVVPMTLALARIDRRIDLAARGMAAGLKRRIFGVALRRSGRLRAVDDSIGFRHSPPSGSSLWRLFPPPSFVHRQG